MSSGVTAFREICTINMTLKIIGSEARLLLGIWDKVVGSRRKLDKAKSFVKRHDLHANAPEKHKNAPVLILVSEQNGEKKTPQEEVDHCLSSISKLAEKDFWPCQD